MNPVKAAPPLPTRTPPLTVLLRLAETLVIGAAGGIAVGLTGLPGGYLSGAILIVACAALAGRPMTVPPAIMRIVFALLGTSLGAVVTPETLQGIAAYSFSIAVLVAAMASIAIGCARYLQWVHGWDKTSAYLASAPGAMSQILAAATDLDADLRAVAIVQSMRVVILAVGLPSGLALLGLVRHAARPAGSALTAASLPEFALLFAAAAAGALLAHRARVPGGLLFGAMFASAALHAAGIVHVTIPWWAANATAIALGCIIGARFSNMRFRLFVKFLGAAFGSFAVALAIAGAVAAALVATLKIPAAEAMIAFAPGSVDAMMLLALALHLDPVYVSAHHVTRILFVAITMPMLARREARLRKEAAGK